MTSIKNMLPKFLTESVDGRAMAAAIDAAIEYMDERKDAGIKLFTDIDTAPEWRLDEIAQETNCIYDFQANVEMKRTWIRNSLNTFSHLGTAQGIVDLMSTLTEVMSVEEDSANYKFGVIVRFLFSTGDPTWAERNINRVKNVRSVFTGISVGTDPKLTMTVSFRTEPAQ